MQIKAKYSWLKHIDFMIVDLLALFISFMISYCLKFNNLDFAQNDEWTRYLFLVLALNIMIGFFVNPYSGILRRPYYMEIIKAFQLSIYNLLFASLVFFAFKIGATYSREMSFYMYGIYFILSTLMKYGWKKLLVSGKVVVNTTKKIPLFVVGSKDTIETTIKNITAGDFQLYDIKGIHLINDTETESIDLNNTNTTVLGTGYVDYVLHNSIGEVLIAVPPDQVEEGILERLNRHGVGINVVVESAIGFQPEDQYIQNFGVYKTLSVGAFSFTPGQMIYLWIKRVIDFLFGVIGTIILIPISIFIKIAYLCTGDKAKIFYRQNRIGQNGKHIRIWKYRSMVANAEEVLQELLKDPKYKQEWDENQKFEKDPRITKVGRFLRKTSIDEFPQFINLIKGDMSLVGPRPLVEGELEQHGGLKLYERVKPGITGWWGCNGRSNIDYRERLELEYYYVRNCGLHLDLLCVARTFLAVLKKDGAQ